MVENIRNLHRLIETYEERLQGIKDKLNQLTDIVHTLVTNQNTQVNRNIQLGGEGDHMLNRGGFP